MRRDLTAGRVRAIADVAMPGPSIQVDRANGLAVDNVEIGIQALGGRFSSARWTDCRIDDSQLEPLTFSKADVSNLRLRRVHLGRSVLSTFVRSTFVDSDVIDSTLTELLVSNCELRNVRFVNVRLQRPMFKNCRFIDVSVSGRVEDAHFVDCDFTRCDFTDATMPSASIFATSVADLALPVADDSILVHPDDLAAAFATTEPTMSLISRMRLQELRDESLASGESGYSARIASATTTMWGPRLLSELFGLEPVDASAVVERLQPVRRTTLAS